MAAKTSSVVFRDSRAGTFVDVKAPGLTITVMDRAVFEKAKAAAAAALPKGQRRSPPQTDEFATKR